MPTSPERIQVKSIIFLRRRRGEIPNPCSRHQVKTPVPVQLIPCQHKPFPPPSLAKSEFLSTSGFLVWHYTSILPTRHAHILSRPRKAEAGSLRTQGLEI